MARETLIKLNDVWKTYEIGNVKVEALRGLDIEVKQGEFVAIMGPSGSGKSTAVNMVGCLDIPTRGEVLLKGRNIARMSESHLAQIRGKTIGFIFQTFNLIGTLSAKENIMLPMIFQNVRYPQREQQARRLLNLVELGDRMEHRPSELSGGQQQRVAIARALANGPEVILADEPTGNLDSKASMMIMDLLKALHEKEKKTLVVVTHDKQVAKYAERVIMLKDGRVMA